MRTYVDRRKRQRNRRIRNVLLLLLIVVVAGTCFALSGGKKDSGGGEADLTQGSSPVQTDREEEKDPQVEPENPFAEFYYYDEEKEARYQAYAQQHPEMEAGEVVWRVDACLDQPFYGEITEIENVDEQPLVANKYFKLPDSFVPKNLVKFPSGRQINAEAKEAYDQLRADAAKQDLRISEGSAYRSIEYQKEVYARYLAKDPQSVVDTYSSRPGHSDHHTGLAIDLLARDGSLTGFEGTAEAKWIEENAYKYGFVIRFPKDLDDITGYVYEPWHIRYVGKEVAERMRQEGIATLEEYKVKYLDHKPPAK